ncbi:fidgetin-like protein 1 isoform X2 [Montipora foliosa]|uniref:fidgetin-like protein 1 isoform X1 n=1 Tax=Montipora foliosa TaxID=591990 RepID=UPI0035F21CC3
MNLPHDDSCSLNMWQRLCLEAESSKSPECTAAAWRRLLIQVATLKKSNKISNQLYTRLFEMLVNNYCQVADNQEPDQGLNNFAETVLTLASGCRNESQNWSPSLSLSSVQDIHVYNSLLKSKRDESTKRPLQSNNFDKSLLSTAFSSLPSEAKAHDETTITEKDNDEFYDNDLFTAESDSVPSALPSSRCINGGTRRSTQDLANTELSLSTNAHQGQPEEQLPSGSGLQAQETVANVQGSLSLRGIKHVHESTRVVLNFDNARLKGNAGIKRKASSDCPEIHSMVPGVLKTTTQSLHDQEFVDRRIPGKTLEKQSCLEVNEENSDLPNFITAREQLVINSKKKNYHQESDPRASKHGAINSTNYGSTRRTLGTRRGPSRQFVPPILNQGQSNEGIESGLKHDRVTNNLDLDERLKNIDQKMVELITNEILDHGPPLSWDDIAGLEFAKSVIKEIVVWPMLRPDIFKGLRGPPKGVLLFGPPGTGKTLIGKCIASQSKATFFSISASSLTSKWVGEGEKMVRALFAVARCHLPAVIFIDEIDSLLSQRTDGENDASRRIKTEFLVQLDGATTSSDDRLLVVGATNRPQEIDEAARRRLVKRLYIPLPDACAREQIITSLLSQQKYSLSKQDLMSIVQHTQGYSGSDMANLCREAALGPIRSIVNIQYIEADQVRPIVFKDFEAALHQVRASVSEKDLDLYTEWNKLYGSGFK